jgi:hypothetical protein
VNPAAGWKSTTTIDDKQLIKDLTDAVSKASVLSKVGTSAAAAQTNQANALRLLLAFVPAKSMATDGRCADDIQKTKANLNQMFKEAFSGPMKS